MEVSGFHVNFTSSFFKILSTVRESLYRRGGGGGGGRCREDLDAEKSKCNPHNP